MKFNENLKYLRKKENLTQEQLAEKLNVSRQAVTKWESGQALPDIANLKEIAVLFGVSTDELLGDEKTKNTTTLDKKLKDLPILMFGLNLFAFSKLIIDFGIENAGILALVLILLIPFEALYIKKYLTNNRRIIDLRETKEGQKARMKIVLKKSIIQTLIFGTLEVITYVVRYIRGLENMNIYEEIVWILVIFIFAMILNYLILKDEVKKYNSK